MASLVETFNIGNSNTHPPKGRNKMSKQAAVEFFAKVNTDAALQQDFLKAIEGKEDESMLMDAARCVAQVGTQHGYDFTLEEAKETYLEIIEKAAAMDVGESGELSDEALEAVAGGMRYWRGFSK